MRLRLILPDQVILAYVFLILVYKLSVSKTLRCKTRQLENLQ